MARHEETHTQHEERTEAVAVQDAEVKHDPAAEIGVDVSASGSYVYIPLPHGWKPDALFREVTVDGVHMEHVANDKDDVWLYRRM